LASSARGSPLTNNCNPVMPTLSVAATCQRISSPRLA
jgi:hypothetical protein